MRILRHPRHPVGAGDLPGDLGVGGQHAGQGGERGRLPCAARAGERDNFARIGHEIEPGHHGRAACGVAHRQIAQAQGSRRDPRAQTHAAADQLAHARDDRLRVLRGVMGDAQLAQGAEALGGEQQHHEGIRESRLAGEQPDAEDDRDHRDGERREQLEGERGEERGAQHPARAPGVLALDGGEPVGLLPVAAEADEHRESVREFGDVVGQTGEGILGGAHAVAAVQADEHHEQRHERQRHGEDERAQRVDREHAEPERERHDDTRDRGGHDPGEPAVEVVEPATRERTHGTGREVARHGRRGEIPAVPEFRRGRRTTAEDPGRPTRGTAQHRPRRREDGSRGIARHDEPGEALSQQHERPGPRDRGDDERRERHARDLRQSPVPGAPRTAEAPETGGQPGHDRTAGTTTCTTGRCSTRRRLRNTQ